MLVGAASLAIAGCQTKAASIEGAGFVLTKPKPETVSYIAKNDRQFAEDTAGNNRACKRAKACRK